MTRRVCVDRRSSLAGLLAGLVAGLSAVLGFGLTPASGAPATEFYRIDSLTPPPGIDPQVGALGVLPDGRLAVAFHRGEVCFYDAVVGSWSVFARGLHEPLGLLALSAQEVLVMQRPELTRLRDTDGDGTADRYETAWDGFGMTGNYHEFAYGPVLDRDGALFVSLNLASTGDGVREEIRGPWAPFGLSHDDFLRDWDRTKSRVSKMYSRVPWRGWVMRLEPGTFAPTPWASGWRSPDGLGFDPAGRLLVTDNQGDWVGTSGLWVAGRGQFAGHPASLVWTPGRRDDPDVVDPAPLAAVRTPPAVLFPHGLMASSPTQPLGDTTGGRFGPFSGQVFVGEMNTPRLLRVMLEDVGGVTQGACTPFLDWSGLRAGNHRLAWLGDGSLVVGQTHLAWAGGAGLQRVTWTGRVPMAVARISLRPGGFLVVFTHPVDDPPSAAAWQIQRYRYAYHADYGSPQLDRTAVVPSAVEWRDGGRSAWVALPEVQAGGTVYEFTLPAVTGAGGLALDQRLVCYTVNAVP
jgi:hypothetical protein